MAAFYALELGGTSGTSGVTGSVDGVPAFKPTATNGEQARVRVSRGSYTLTGTAVTTSDVLHVCIIPAGALFYKGWMFSGVTLGSSTVALGIAGTVAKYKAAATFTAVDTPTPFGIASIVASQTPLAADERIIATIAAANLPVTGQPLVIAVEYTNG
jgi:hypothetical protein